MDPEFKLPGFIFEKHLGVGGFGAVFLFKSELSPTKFYAIKQVSFKGIFEKLVGEVGLDKPEALKKTETLMKREVDIHYLLDEEEKKRTTQDWNLPFFYFACIDPITQKDYLFAIEYCQNGSLYSRILEFQKKKTSFPEKEVIRITYGIIKALKQLHDLKIAHRDLSSKNVMFDKNDVPKLIDFGAGRIVHDKFIPSTLMPGNPLYFPPETEINGYKYTDESFMSGDRYMGIGDSYI